MFGNIFGPSEEMDIKTRIEQEKADRGQCGLAWHQTSGVSANDLNAMINAAHSQLGMGMAAQVMMTPPELDVFYVNGAKMPLDWRGAEVTSCSKKIIAGDMVYELRFCSKWGPDVTMRVSAQKYSGDEVDKLLDV